MRGYGWRLSWATVCRKNRGYTGVSQPPVGPSVDSLWHPWLTTTNLSYRFPIFETSATALCGTTGINCFRRSVLRDCISMCFDICAINIRVNIRVRGLHLVFKKGVLRAVLLLGSLAHLVFIFTSYIHYLFTFCFVPWYPMDSQFDHDPGSPVSPEVWMTPMWAFVKREKCAGDLRRPETWNIVSHIFSNG